MWIAVSFRDWEEWLLRAVRTASICIGSDSKSLWTLLEGGNIIRGKIILTKDNPLFGALMLVVEISHRFEIW